MSEASNQQKSDTQQTGEMASSSPPANKPAAAAIDAGTPVTSTLSVPVDEAQLALAQLEIDIANRMTWEAERRRKRRRLRTCLILFLLTFASTTIVGADFWPVEIISGFFNAKSEARILKNLDYIWPVATNGTSTLADRFWQSIKLGCTYSCPLMLILVSHEMGHYLQAVRYRVPASLPFFIPLPLPPLGTMGAVILQGKGAADRKKMFDIAVSGPIAGLVVTFPILYFGIKTSQYAYTGYFIEYEFGQTILLKWLITAIHGTAPAGMVFEWNGYAKAGWVGVFITAMNLLPIGQLDGGHLMYTLVGRIAHWIAWGLILFAVAAMIYGEHYSYVLLLILLTLTGPRHPPTADDSVPIGWRRHLLGWLTLSFLIIGFTPQPIIIQDRRPDPAAISNAIEAVENWDWADWESLQPDEPNPE